MQDSIDGGANRHLDAVPRGARQHRRRRRLAFDHLAAALHVVGERRALAQRQAQRAVARQRAVAGQHQVAEAAQARQRLELGAHRLAEPRHLGEAARDQRCGGVVAEAAALDDAGGDRQHVLDRAAQRHAQHVVRPVGPERAGRQRRRQRRGRVSGSRWRC